MPVVTEAVGKAWRLRGGLATGWPVLAWVAKFKPDPLRRLHLDRLGAGRKQKEIDPSGVGRTSLPATSGVQQARVDTALRALADQAADGPEPRLGRRDQARRPAPPKASCPTRSTARSPRPTSTWPRTAAGGRRSGCCSGCWSQRVVGGLAWLGAAFVLAYLQLPPLPEVIWWGFPAPTVLTLGGVLAGLLVAGLARIGVEVGARRRSRAARGAAPLDRPGDRRAGGRPVEAESERYERARLALERARG